MRNGTRDYWSFVEKIQDASDYVQELLTENSRLRRRMADLQTAKEELAKELEQLRQMSAHGRRPDQVLRYPSDAERSASGLHSALSERSLRLAH